MIQAQWKEGMDWQDVLQMIFSLFCDSTMKFVWYGHFVMVSIKIGMTHIYRKTGISNLPDGWYGNTLE